MKRTFILTFTSLLLVLTTLFNACKIHKKVAKDPSNTEISTNPAVDTLNGKLLPNGIRLGGQRISH